LFAAPPALPATGSPGRSRRVRCESDRLHRPDSAPRRAAVQDARDRPLADQPSPPRRSGLSGGPGRVVHGGLLPNLHRDDAPRRGRGTLLLPPVVFRRAAECFGIAAAPLRMPPGRRGRLRRTVRRLSRHSPVPPGRHARFCPPLRADETADRRGPTVGHGPGAARAAPRRRGDLRSRRFAALLQEGLFGPGSRFCDLALGRELRDVSAPVRGPSPPGRGAPAPCAHPPFLPGIPWPGRRGVRGGLQSAIRNLQSAIRCGPRRTFMNVLLTCAGRRSYLVQFFREALCGRGEVIACDCCDNAPALADADRSFVVPRVNAPDYADTLLAVCRENAVRLVIGVNDLELADLARQAPRL